MLMSGHEALSTDFEQWAGLSPAAQVRPIAAQGRLLYVAIFGTELGAEQGEPEGDDGDRGRRREEQRDRKWQALPRELKLAIKRVHVNLGHASMPAMLRALRIARASETAVKACRLFRCPECPRLLEPKRPRPSKLPITDEFNVMIGMDVFQEKDAQGQAWTSWAFCVRAPPFRLSVCCAINLLQPDLGRRSGILELIMAELGWLPRARHHDRPRQVLPGRRGRGDGRARLLRGACFKGCTLAAWTSRAAR